MTKEEALKIIRLEQLKHFNWFCEHEIRPNEVGIKELINKWLVYTADERTSLVSEVLHQHESDALEDFIDRLRADKILSEL